ncbi:uncharacterized protein LOC126665134 isoform X2 [Mercurialis annua]|uniref:uncharacterized protein LOC126665134 isoform X2 n=1 Tax=Mercurialis annua TaxID=3986 RepID=UPI00216080C5|nr:uncharacterized protein LOC126665134 isoform X2 [Mercurialis annua]
MPRPGPRPYECVRRAWHSDRHQPMRGSIIQQIFRVVNETHSGSTKKNKEWQEKLPIVVLKAEEIMYSKANSEAEYMNLETLWDRVNDAINIIIRRDESTETGQLLPPCIEAALNLGCIQVRASRSQRHCNPRTYLTSRGHEPMPAPHSVSEKTNDKQCSQLSPVQSSSQFARATTAVTSRLPISESSCHLAETSNVAASCSYPLLYENIPPGCSQLMLKETSKQLKSGSVYPLYYGNNYHIEQPHLVSQVPEKNSNTVFFGTPIISSAAQPAEIGSFKNFLTCGSAEIAAKRISQADLGNTHEKLPGMQCDLSLRLGLGLFSESSVSMGRSSIQKNEDVESIKSQDKSRRSEFSLRKNKELYFPSSMNTNDPLESQPVKWFATGEDEKLVPTIRKRKAPSNVDGQFFWQPEFPSNQFIGRIERQGHNSLSSNKFGDNRTLSLNTNCHYV